MSFAYPYIRQSLDETRQENSADYQRREIYDWWLARKDAEKIPDWCEHPPEIDERRKTPFHKRPVAKALLARIKPGDYILLHKLDRMAGGMFKQIRMLDELQDMGVRVRAVHDPMDMTTLEGQLNIAILAYVSARGSQDTSVRTKSSLAYCRQNGLKTGGCRPYGMRIVLDGTRIRNGVEIPIKRLVRDDVEYERLQALIRHAAKHGPSATAEWANAQGWATASGLEWSRHGIRKLMGRKM